MSNAKKLLLNTVLLTITTFIMRTVSVSFNVYLTNKIGADGIGLFQLISTVYAMAITFSVAGIRLAAMRLVADNMALGKYNDRQIIRRCLIYSLICGTVIAVILSLFSDLIGLKWIGDIRSSPSLKVLCLSLPFVSMSAALNGYFTSVGKLVRYTGIQLVEQVFKITVTVLCLRAVLSRGLEASCVAIVAGISLSEIFSLTCSYILYRLTVRKPQALEKPKEIWTKLLRISIPDTVGSEMRSILMTVEHLLIPVGFRKSGSNPQTALATYGIIHGMSLPLVLYPSALLSSLSGLLVPEIASLHISGDKNRINYMIARVLHLTLLFSIGTAGIMYFSAEKLSLAVYGNDSAYIYIQIFSPLIPIMYMDMTVDGMLKGLDQQVSYMRYNIIDASLCVILVYFLVPVYSVRGYIIVVFISEIVNLTLSFRRLTIVSEVRISLFKDMLVPLLCVISANLGKNLLLGMFNTLSGAKAAAAAEIIFSIILYVGLLMIFQSVDKEELQWMRRLTRGNKRI